MITIVTIGSTSYTYAATNNISIYVNNKLLKSDVSPLVKHGTTYVPLSFVAKELGAEVKWKSPMVEIRKNSVLLSLCVTDSQYDVNGGDVNILPSPVYMVNGRVMVPLRFISQELGCKVNYDANSKTINITQAGNIGDNYESESTSSDVQLSQEEKNKQQYILDNVAKVERSYTFPDRETMTSATSDVEAAKIFSKEFFTALKTPIETPDKKIIGNDNTDNYNLFYRTCDTTYVFKDKSGKVLAKYNRYNEVASNYISRMALEDVLSGKWYIDMEAKETDIDYLEVQLQNQNRFNLRK